jgi:putative flavoprotein involved in K+ transport
VIGAGQAGLAVAARLKQLGIQTAVIDREKRVGDNWRNRYQSLLLHNQIWANHLPYLPFPESWPAYLSKDEMADWLETYAKVLGHRRQARDEARRRALTTSENAAGTCGLPAPTDDGGVHPRHVSRLPAFSECPTGPRFPAPIDSQAS